MPELGDVSTLMIRSFRMNTSTRRRFLARTLSGAVLASSASGWDGWNLVPYVVGANTAITGYGLFQAISLLRELGFPTIEVQNLVGVPEPAPGKFPGFQLDRASDEDRRKVKQALAGFQHITAHLPYTGLEYFSPPGPEADDGIRTLEAAMRTAAFLGARVAVMHPKPGKGMTLEESWPIMIRRIRRWGDLAKEHGFRLALETSYPRSVAEFVRLVREVDHEHVGATLDVGHQSHYRELLARVAPGERSTAKGIRAYNDTNIEIVEGLGAKLIHLHVHDIDPATWKEHQPLVYGFVDYPRLIAKLREVRYEGVMVFEIAGPADRMRQYLAQAKRKLEGYLGRA